MKKTYASIGISLQRIDRHNKSISGYVMTWSRRENYLGVKRIHRFRNIFIFVPKNHTFWQPKLKHNCPPNRITLRARKVLRVIFGKSACTFRYNLTRRCTNKSYSPTALRSPPSLRAISLQRIDRHNESISGYVMTWSRQENCSGVNWTYRLGARGKPSTFVYRAGWLVEPFRITS